MRKRSGSESGRIVGIAAMGLALASSTGCASSSFRPPRSPRIVASSGSFGPTFIKNGREYSGGFFGGGLVEVVRGNKAAEDEAIRARNLTVGGFGLQILGLSGVVTGVVLGAQDDQSTRTAGMWVGLGGAVTLLVGSLIVRSASPHTYDAINIYNDDFDNHPPPPKPLDMQLRSRLARPADAGGNAAAAPLVE